MPAPTTTSGAVGALAGATLAALTLAGGDFECPDDYRCTQKTALTQAITNPVVNDLDATCLRTSAEGVIEACYERSRGGAVVDLDCKDLDTISEMLGVCIADGSNCDRLAEHQIRAAAFTTPAPDCQPGLGPAEPNAGTP